MIPVEIEQDAKTAFTSLMKHKTEGYVILEVMEHDEDEDASVDAYQVTLDELYIGEEAFQDDSQEESGEQKPMVEGEEKERPHPKTKLGNYFLEIADSHECRFAIAKTNAQLDDLSDDQVYFISWFPTESTVKQRMMYKSARPKLVEDLDNILGELENRKIDVKVVADELEDLTVSELDHAYDMAKEREKKEAEKASASSSRPGSEH